MKTGLVAMVALSVLAACAPAPRERGVGFDDRATFELDRARRQAALAAPVGTFGAPPPIATGPISAAPVPDTRAIPSSALAAAGIGAAGGFAPPPAQTASPLPATSNPGISDEQNFDAVSERETLESDAQRRAAAIAARQVIAPQPLPERPAETGPNIVAYAIAAPNARGQEWYSRSLLSGQGRFQRNCAVYPTADDAQRAFLARGGPDRDPLGIDPDGDGFACGWDPAPFRQAVRN